ncbi:MULTISPECIES: (Na+)-NQR maturation NqrM [Pasteurellaceae]|uniref:PF04400 family protein n=1 Tax=Pasteurella bettyae CCUG 2042 TaxID=1095749 RepID=I3DJE0_9PAST|nr:MULTISPECIES: (Na+)-NQR maturation NqrM [Pasteurellaceae]EIJ71833.1 PF04400 family protein [Pasteurella bettyae CCUG 2042]SUB22384.1 putative YheO-like protein [Pasteurella bettyae]
MKLFLITFALFLLIILAMALGYIVKRKALKGSCGGISALGMQKMCDCEEPCDNLKDKVAKGEADPSELERFKKTPQFYEVN